MNSTPKNAPGKDQYILPLTGGGSGMGWKALPLFKAANDALPLMKASGE